jgi:hypothetical protein
LRSLGSFFAGMPTDYGCATTDASAKVNGPMSEESRERHDVTPGEITSLDRARIHAAIDRLIDPNIDARARERSYLFAEARQTTGSARP